MKMGDCIAGLQVICDVVQSLKSGVLKDCLMRRFETTGQYKIKKHQHCKIDHFRRLKFILASESPEQSISGGESSDAAMPATPQQRQIQPLFPAESIEQNNKMKMIILNVLLWLEKKIKNIESRRRMLEYISENFNSAAGTMSKGLFRVCACLLSRLEKEVVIDLVEGIQILFYSLSIIRESFILAVFAALVSVHFITLDMKALSQLEAVRTLSGLDGANNKQYAPDAQQIF
ncbi:predicted protein [Sclerotinia sclerotiorum 1980 UF-70]|uniref:Uncharacterized protein n=1 Tax=Sclerotinia sclerotiorum (strain ATCC 18683 / 1980 / Ss-1) TaxID=665079 RepID=A7E8Q3_SCLS1|nr:predicted protein [Sclerotinia sclerotiorum 1980 UF-70]EDN96755.1 predicted protein [Sclerotinia sclerotiorum 1980 UF-70]